MKKISRKLLLSILSMAFAVVALGTTTFAWFTTNATVTATTQIKVQSTTDSIQISDDCFSWGASVSYNLTTTELGAATYVQGTKSTLMATDVLTDMDGHNSSDGAGFKKVVMYLKVTSNKSIKISNDSTSSTGAKAYTLTKDFEFKAQATAENKVQYNAGAKVLLNAENALRGTLDVTNAVSITDTKLKDANKGNAVTTFTGTNPTNTRLQTLAGYSSTNQQSSGGTATTSTGSSVVNLGQSLAGDNCANAYIEAVLGTNFSNSSNTDTYKAANANYVASNNNSNILTSTGWTNKVVVNSTTPNSVYRLTFIYWLEGYDADCFDAIFAQTISQTLTFTAGDPVQTPANDGNGNGNNSAE